MRFSIVTPSYRSSEWLRLCIASVADQGVELEHIVQDAGSDDGTLDWLPGDPRIKPFIEKDQGMYDAVNRGLKRASGEILAYLNCDEQYLPGALRRIGSFFEAHPDVDVAFGDVVVVDSEGRYLRHRKMQVPQKYHTWTCHLSTLSCGMFFRRRIVFDEGLLFDPQLRDVGDGEWMVRLLKRGTKMSTLRKFTSVFTFTGSNMSVGQNARREAKNLRATAPAWARALRPLLIVMHRARRLAGGMYSQEPFTYAVYTRASNDKRQKFEVDFPRYRS